MSDNVLAVVGGEKFISGLSSTQLLSVKAALTTPNPRYNQAKYFQKVPPWVLKDIPRELSFYNDRGNGVISVPRGFEIDVNKHKYNVVKKPVKWPKPKLKPRDWQKDVVKHWSKVVKLPSYDGVSKATPGSGKTICGIFVAHLLQQKTLVIVHTSSIMQAWVDDLKEMFGDSVKPGIIQGQTKRIGEHITIAMIQTLSKMDAKQWASEFGTVIVDECHHIAALTLFEALRNCHAAYRFGVTATLSRSDRLTSVINWVCGPVRTDADKDLNHTVPLMVTRLNTPFRLETKAEREEIKILKQSTLHKRQAQKKKRLDAICDLYEWTQTQKKYRGPSLILCSTLAMCDALIKRLSARALDVVLFSSDMDKDTRKVMLEDAKKGNLPIIISTYPLLSEGVNVPCWRNVFITQTLSSEGLTRQIIGRVERPAPGKVRGYVWDFVDKLSPQAFDQWTKRHLVYAKAADVIRHFKIKQKKGQPWRPYRKKSTKAQRT